MPKFDEFINGFDPSAEGFDLDAFRASALAAYNDDLSIREAKINQLAAEHSAATTEIGRLKSANYDLLVSSGTKPGPGEQSSGIGGDDDVPLPTVADLFKKKE